MSRTRVSKAFPCLTSKVTVLEQSVVSEETHSFIRLSNDVKQVCSQGSPHNLEFLDQGSCLTGYWDGHSNSSYGHCFPIFPPLSSFQGPPELDFVFKKSLPPFLCLLQTLCDEEENIATLRNKHTLRNKSLSMHVDHEIVIFLTLCLFCYHFASE